MCHVSRVGSDQRLGEAGVPTARLCNVEGHEPAGGSVRRPPQQPQNRYQDPAYPTVGPRAVRPCPVITARKVSVRVRVRVRVGCAHACKSATRRRGLTQGCGSVPGRTRAVSACTTRATRLARTRKRALPLGRMSVQARPHRLRSKRDATRRSGAAGRCGAAVFGQRVRGRPVPKGTQELHQLHKCPELCRNPCQ